MTGEQPLVSVVVVNYNRAELLKECLDSLTLQTYPDVEILVVDNGSTDHSRKVVESFASARAKLIPLTRNIGFAGACNRGIAEASGEWIALLNNDARADSRWIAELVDAAHPETGIGMIASKVLSIDGRTIDKAGHLIYWDGQNRGRGTGEPESGQFDRMEDALFPDGCAAFYCRTLLEETGGFDESFFAYADDADLGLRARWLGWNCRYAPRAVVYHHHSSTSGPFSPQKIYWVERNRLWLALKNLPLPLLLVSPLFTLNRWLWNLLAAAAGRGPAAAFRSQNSPRVVFLTILQACRDGLAGMPQMLRKRQQLRKMRRVSNRQFYGFLYRFRISARRLAFAPRQSGR